MQKIKFGVSVSLSGRYSIQGEESFEGLALWVKDINQRGGVFVKEHNRRLPIEFICYDDESSIDECQRIVERLIVKDKVDVLIGPYSSGHTLAAARVAEEYKKILWNHGGSSDEIFKQGFKYLVSSITPASRYLIGIIEMVRELDKEADRLAIFQAEDSGFSTNVAEGAKQYGEEKGFQVREFKYASGTDDFSRLLNELKGQNPDVILGVGRADDDLLLAKRIIESKVYAKAIGLVVASIKAFKDNLGKHVEGFLAPSQWEPGIGIKSDFGPTAQEFFMRFRDEYRKEPDYLAAQGYNIGLVIDKCIKQSGTLDDLSLRYAANLVEFKTLYGSFKITPDTGSQTAHSVLTVQWQNGKKLIVHPEETAEAQPLYPGC